MCRHSTHDRVPTVVLAWCFGFAQVDEVGLSFSNLKHFGSCHKIDFELIADIPKMDEADTLVHNFYQVASVIELPARVPLCWSFTYLFMQYY